jgi:hypothetical protein
MKPVREFIRNITHNRIVEYDTLQLIRELDKAGYYGYNTWQINFSDSEKCIKWCKENCPNEYENIAGFLYFDNKDHAMLMRLSVI